MATKRDKSEPKRTKPKLLKTVGMRLPETTLEELRVIAEKEKRTIANLLLVLVDEALEARREKKGG